MLVMAVMLPILSMAHGYWLETKGSGKVGEPVKVLLFFGEYGANLREKGTKLDKMADIKVALIDVVGNKTDIQMTQTDTHWEGTFTPKTAGNYQILGINDTREVQDWTKHKLGITRPVQFLRTNYVAGNIPNNQSKTYQFFDIVAELQKDVLKITIIKDKQPSEKTSVTIINPQTWEKTNLTNTDGTVTFPLAGKGLYLIEAEWIDTTKGNFKGKDYESIRYKSETTFVVN